MFRSVFAVAFAAAAVPSVAAGQPWRPVLQQSFSAPTRAALDAWKVTSTYEVLAKAHALAKPEVERCVSSEPIERCIAMIIEMRIGLDDDALVERALAAADKAWPVDTLLIAGARRPIPGSTDEIIDLLSEAAHASESIHPSYSPQSIRRRLAVDVAKWRAGHQATLYTSIDSIASNIGADHPLVAELKNFGAVDLIDIHAERVPGELELSWATEAHAKLGDQVATNLAVMRWWSGDNRGAEKLALDGYAALRAKYGDEDPRTVAAMRLLAKFYNDQNKTALAIPFAERVYRLRETDPHATAAEKVDALRIYALTQKPPLNGALMEKAVAAAAAAGDKIPAGVRADLLADAALERIVAKDFKTAEKYAREAHKMTGLRRAYTLHAAAAMAQGPEAIRRSGDESIEYLLNSGDQRALPIDHIERILNSMMFAYFYVGWNALYAPYFGRAAAEGVQLRLSTRKAFDAEAADELKQFREVFLTQVRANWQATKSLQK